MKQQKKIILQGPFMDEDVAMFMNCLRWCERKQQDEKFFMGIERDENTRSVEDLAQFMKDNFPAVKGRPVRVETFERK